MNAETDKSYLKDPMFESVKENQKPTKVSDIEETNNLTNGYWTLGTYDGKIEQRVIWLRLQIRIER